jgi:hypothetical protein
MTALSMSDFTSMVKQKYIYSKSALIDVMRQTPLLGLLPKDTELTDYNNVPIEYGATGGVSSTIAKAITNQLGGKYTKFVCRPVNLYAYGLIANAVIRNCKGPEALLKPLDNEMKNMKLSFGVQLSANMFSNKGFALGRAYATPGGTAYDLVLKDTYDAIKFQVGQKIAAASTDGTSGSLRDSGDTCTISAINRQTGTLTTDTGYWTTVISGLVGDDYLFLDGTFGVGADGIDGWVPATAPGGSDSFNGVNRSVDVERLAGVRIDGTGMPFEEAVNIAGADCSYGGLTPNLMVVHPTVLAKLKNAYKDQWESAILKANGGGNKRMMEIGYAGLIVHTDFGDLEVLSDRFCPRTAVYLLSKDSWTVASCGDLVQFMQFDPSSDSIFRVASGTDSTEFALVAQWQLICNNPGRNARITIS